MLPPAYSSQEILSLLLVFNIILTLATNTSMMSSFPFSFYVLL